MSDWEELGPGVFRRRYPLFDQNVGLVCGRDEALLVDTRPTPSATRELLADLAGITRLPVRHVVNTHFHFDHTFGNEFFPQAAIWGHRRCAARLRRDGERLRAAVIAWAPDLASELAAVRIVPPGNIVSAPLDLLVGGRTVTLDLPGRGHTDGDLAVLVPDAGVLFAGDLIEEGAPPSFEDSYPLEWPAAVDRLLDVAAVAVDRGRVVPGHGDVVGRAFVADQLALLRTVAGEARRSYERGLPASQAAASLPLSREVALVAVRRAYRQLRATRPGRVAAGG